MNDDTSGVPQRETAGRGGDGVLIELMSAKEQLQFVLAGADQEEISARLERVVEAVIRRLRAAISDGAGRMAEAEAQARAKADRAWQPLVHAEIARIENEGALIPGLSHQEIYLAELREACGRAETIEQLRGEIEGLIASWGSVLKYPLFGSARKKELTKLLKTVEDGFPEARSRALRSVQDVVASRRQDLHEATRDKIQNIALEFGALLSACFESDLTTDETIRLRWLVIGLTLRRVFARVMDAVKREDDRTLDDLYFVVERLLMQIYDSFKTFIAAYTRRAKETGNLDAVRSIVDLEIRATQTPTAQLEQQIRAQSVAGVIGIRIKDLLRSEAVRGAADPEAFVAVSAGLRGDSDLGRFLAHLKSSPELEDHIADEVAVAVKTTVEPFRTLNYVAITLLRYLKGLQNFKPA